MHMVMFVLDDPDLLDRVLEAWEAAGATGVTIVESTGIRRRRGAHVPARYAFGHRGRTVEEGHYTLFAVVRDEAQAQAFLQAAEAVVGDLGRPDSGILAAWPLTLVKGLTSGGEGAAG